MKRLYVVYWPDDAPFAECEKLRDAYSQARECFDNYWGHISIDVYFWEGNKWYTHECSYWDFYFIDRKWEAILPEDLGTMWVHWYGIFYCDNEQALNDINNICSNCELELNDIYNKRKYLPHKK